MSDQDRERFELVNDHWHDTFDRWPSGEECMVIVMVIDALADEVPPPVTRNAA